LTHIGGVISSQYNGLNYPVTTVEYLVVAGGGGSPSNWGGGGGAGGLLQGLLPITLGASYAVALSR
jgi:hypothetical protein